MMLIYKTLLPFSEKITLIKKLNAITDNSISFKIQVFKNTIQQLKKLFVTKNFKKKKTKKN